MMETTDKLLAAGNLVGLKAKQIAGIPALVGRVGVVADVIIDEKGAVHCSVDCRDSGLPYGYFWCPALLMEFSA